MKTKEELNAIKLEVEALNAKLGELTDDEMEQVIGGIDESRMLGRHSIREPLSGTIVMDATPPAADIIEELKS